MSNSKTEEFFDYIHVNLVIFSKITVIQLTNFLIILYKHLLKRCIYLHPREMQLEKKLKLKLWFTLGLLKSIPTKNKMYKCLHKFSID